MSARAVAVAVEQEVAGWGRYPSERCQVYRPEHRSELHALVTSAPHSLAPRGLGRSYGDASLNRDRGVVLTERLDRLIAFDPESGLLHCEAAVSLADIIEIFLPRGFFLPVTPGSKHITLGGALAADVHGKNHHHSGSTAAFVEDFSLLTASGDVLRCARDENVDLFWATLGGMGLTGVILDARIRLLPVETAYMEVDVERARDLDDVMERCEARDAEYAYGVAWIDCLSRGRALGRSVLLRANHVPLDALPPSRRDRPLQWRRLPKPRVPFRLPNVTLNPLSTRAVNEVYYRIHRPGRRISDCDGYFYPLDQITNLNHVYGRRGVLQYQCVLPEETAREGLVEILERLSSARRSSFLAVLKRFGPGSEGLLSFPRPGYTLALDLPNTGDDLLAELARLDQVVARCAGRIYLAKDACLEPELFAEMYPGLARFREIKQKVDPDQRFASSQARRLGIVEPA